MDARYLDIPELSLVAPMYNEKDVIQIFFETIRNVLEPTKISFEIICVNDGSTDNTLEILLKESNEDNRIKIINLSRNYGKEIALSAGLDHVQGKAVIPIDCDLQDPPELIVTMYDKWKSGYDVVLAKRIDRNSDDFMKRFTSKIFYKLIRIVSDVDIPENVGDYRLMDQKVIKALSLYRERSRFMKGIMASLGFKTTTVEYTRQKRVAGFTKWNYYKLYQLALEGIVSFTSFPLKIWSYIGVTFALIGFIYAGYLVLKTLILGVDVPGYASLMVVVLTLGGMILTCLGIIGEYISRIFIEVKQRPIYIIDKTYGFDNHNIRRTIDATIKN